MPSTTINGYTPNHLSSWTDGYVASFATIPSGRIAADGRRLVIITAVAAYLRGNGATRSCLIYLGDNPSSSFNVSAGSSATVTPGIGIFAPYANGTADTFRCEFSGSTFFGWFEPASGNVIVDPYGTVSGQAICGAIDWMQAPTAPTGLNFTNKTATGVTVNFTGASDDGASAITGHRLQYSTDPTFATGVTTVDFTGLTRNVTGLTPGLTYYFRVAARNYVTTYFGTVGVWSSSASVTMLSGVRTAKADLSGFELAKVFTAKANLSGWETSEAEVYVPSGSSWVPAG